MFEKFIASLLKVLRMSELIIEHTLLNEIGGGGCDLDSQLKLLLGIAIGQYLAENDVASISEEVIFVPISIMINFKATYAKIKRPISKTVRRFPGSKLVNQWKSNLREINEIVV